MIIYQQQRWQKSPEFNITKKGKSIKWLNGRGTIRVVNIKKRWKGPRKFTSLA